MNTEEDEVTNARIEDNEVELPSDYVLISLVDFCNNSTFEVGITLFMGGSIITGIMVSGKNYTDSVASLMDKAGGNALAEWFRNFGEETFGPESKISEDIPTMIHLKEATIYDGTVTHKLGWWRGRIKSVDGHSMGIMSRSN